MKFQISEYTVKEFEELTPQDINWAIDYLKPTGSLSEDPDYKLLKDKQRALRVIKNKNRLKACQDIHKKALIRIDLENKKKFKEGPHRNKKWWKKLTYEKKEYYTNHFLEEKKKQKMKELKKIEM